MKLGEAVVIVAATIVALVLVPKFFGVSGDGPVVFVGRVVVWLVVLGAATVVWLWRSGRLP